MNRNASMGEEDGDVTPDLSPLFYGDDDDDGLTL